MKATIVSANNFKTIQIPKELFEKSGLSHDVDVEVKKGKITITTPNKNTVSLLALASEITLAKDWLRPEEEEAWATYQLDK